MLAQYLHNPIAIPYNAGWSKRMLDAALQDMASAISSAAPSQEVSAQMKTLLILNQWSARRRVNSSKQGGQGASPHHRSSSNFTARLKEFALRRRVGPKI